MISPSLILNRSLTFIKEVLYESKKIVWPEKNDVIITTIIVFILSIIFGIFFFLVDQIIGSLVYLILGMRFNG